MALKEKISAVADAIRTKTGKSEKLTLDQMPAEIVGIQTGGGSVKEYDVDDVTFYDYDGTIVYSCSMAEAQNLMELPTPPEHKGLVFQEWNWTLEEIKSSSVGADVGPMYDTEDGAVVYNIEVRNEIERNNICLKFEEVSGATRNPHVTIDWGDGARETSTDAVSFSGIGMEHVYKKNGEYSIRVKKTDPDSDGFKITYVYTGNRSLISQNMEIDDIIKSVLVGSDCGEIDSYTFAGTNVIRHITFHKKLILPSNTSLLANNSGGLNFLALPPTQTDVYDIISGCAAVRVISIPPTVQSCRIGSPVGLYRIVFPDSVITVDRSGSATSKLKDIRFGNRVQKIESYAFSNAERCISELSLPASLKTLGKSCFTGMYNIKVYRFKSSEPPVMEATGALGISKFGTQSTKIYVPAGCADAYKAATNWAALADYIVEEEE